MAHLSLCLLGQFKVTLSDAPVTDFATDKARALLAYLAVEADRPHRREALAGLLWPDQPQRKASQNLRQALLYLRQALGECDEAAPFLQITRESVQFNSECGYWLDVAEFEALLESCASHPHSRLEACLLCLRRLEQAAKLYRGEFLAQFFLSDSSAFEEWALLKREWLHRKVIVALGHLTHYHERRGDREQARQCAWRQVELEPWREEAHRQLMRLLALDGQRSAALAQYETCRRALAQELGVGPTSETVALYERIRAGESLPSPAPLHNLPHSPTSLVGREEELIELAELIANPDCRLVTLAGPGGIGKSRLALQAAADQIGAFAHGVYFVPLASVGSAELFVSAIANALGLPFSDRQDPKEQFLSHLREQEALLVLDNMEHLLPSSLAGGADLVAEVLRRAPGVMLLVTSRERLNLQEEWVYEVEGLTYPKGQAAPDGRSYSAADLFQQRARQAQRRFALSEAEAPHVARICQLVEGMPLGIELAAAWVSTHSCDQIARQLERNLDILTTRLRNVPARQQSIRATFEYSWQSLSEAEQDVLMRLSVFRGGFGPQAAAQVAGALAPALSSLGDKSLIRRASSERYDMHELLRQYAAEKLAAHPPERENTQIQYVRYFAAFLRHQEERLKGVGQKQALAEIALEIENARQAWQLAVERGWLRELDQSLGSLHQFYEIQSRFQEGIELLAQVLDRWSQDWWGHAIISRVMSRQGALYHRTGLYEQARAVLEQSLAIAERLNVPAEQVFCLVHLANVARSQGKHQETDELAQRSLALARQIDDSGGTAHSLFLLGAIRYRAGQVDEAEALLEESLAVGRASGHLRLALSPLNTLADIACYRGDYVQARPLFEECLALSRELGDQFNAAVHLNNLGTVLHVLEKLDEARSLYQESLDICRKIGDPTGQAVALSNLGEVAFALGACDEAYLCYQEGLAIGRSIQDQWTIMICLNNLGEVACAQGNYGRARAYLAEAMQAAIQTQTWTILMKILVNLGVLLVRRGQADRGLELLALAREHPASERDLQKKIDRLSAELGLVLPQSAPRPLEQVIAETTAGLWPNTMAGIPA